MCHATRRHHHRTAARSPFMPLQRPQERVGDEDRERAVTLLGEHHAAGRLSAEELDERAQRALAARTRGELDALLVDFPWSPPPPRARHDRRGGDGVREHLVTFLLVNLLLIAIWAATGGGYFWPVWPLLGWGFAVLSHATGRHGGARRRTSHPQ